MKILFMSLLDFKSISEKNIYADLLREFINHGHEIYVISPIEKRDNLNTYVIKEEKCQILKLKIGNIQKTNYLEKGISTLTLKYKIIKGIKKYFDNTKFDLIIYPTPPITFLGAVTYIKERDAAVTYLLLKDIFPQNAVDINILSKYGVKGIIYKYFRKKEKKLYQISDYIGCMSQANLDYILKYNPEVHKEKVEICPNCIDASSNCINSRIKQKIRQKYSIPLDKTVFVYGGNFGKPQGIDFIMRCLEVTADIPKVFFLLIGSGTEYEKLNLFLSEKEIENVKLVNFLPKEKYDLIVKACDVGLLFLDYRFTIPNFPSRVLTYMDASLPVIAATDMSTDIGKLIEKYNMGFWCTSIYENEFYKLVIRMKDDILRNKMGKNARKSLIELYSCLNAYETIMKHFS